MKLRDLLFRGVLEDDEHVVRVFRRLMIVLISEIIGWVLLIGIVHWAVVTYIARWEFWILLPFYTIATYKVLVLFNRWYFNAVLMTNQNIIITEWQGFFHQRSIVISYWNLDEPQIEKKGLFAFIRNYGDVTFVKLNSGDKYTFKKLAHPHKVVKIIHHYKGQALHEKNFQEESALKNLISDMVQSHVRANGVPELKQNTSFTNRKSTPVFFSDETLEYEKQLDDFGGIEIDLSDDDE